MRYSLFLLLIGFLTISTSLTAQSNPELVIEDTIGSPLQGQLTWLDDERLLVGTSAETRLYQPATSTEPVYTIPDGGNFSLIDGEIVLDEQRWDSATGEHLGEVETTEHSNPVSGHENADGTIQYQLVQESDTSYVQIDSPELSFQIPIPDKYDYEYEFRGIDFVPNSSNGLVNFAIPLGDGYEQTLYQLWNLETGNYIAEIWPDWETVSNKGFFQDGRRLLIGSYSDAPYGGGASIVIWDTATGERLYRGSAYYYSTVLFSSDGQFAIFEREEGLVIWGMEEIGVLREELIDYESSGPYDDFQFSPDEQSLLAIRTGAIKLWDISELENGTIPTEASQVLEGDFGNKLGLFPDGQRFYSFQNLDEGARIHIWEFPSLEKIAELPLEGVAWLYTLSFNANGTLFGAFNWEHSYIWNTATWDEPLVLAAGLSRNPSWSQAAKWDDGKVILHDIAQQTNQSITVIEDNRGTVLGMNAEANWAAFRQGERLKIYNLQTDTRIAEYDSKAGRITLNPYSSTLIHEYGTVQDYKIDIVEVADGMASLSTLNLSLEPYPYFYPNSSIMSPDGRFISLTNQGGCQMGGRVEQLILDAQTSEVLASSYTESCGPVTHFISPDGKLLFTAWDWYMATLDLNQEAIALDEHGAYLSNGFFRGVFGTKTSFSISPDSQYLSFNATTCEGVTECPTPTIVILPLASPSHDLNEFVEPVFAVLNANTALFSPDSQFILTNQSLWSITGTEIFGLPNQLAAFDPAGNWLVSYSDNELLLWDWVLVQTGTAEPLHRLPVEGITKLAFNADGSFLYAQRAGDVLRLRVQIPQT